ncbi:MAG: carboxypeptidase-like regulatory domain-containing protein [Kofleriaceae bacterium]
MPSGRWIADAFSPGYTSPGGVELDAGKGVPELSLARGATIEGRVLDAEGRPIAGAAVRALGAGVGANELSAAVDQDRLRRFSGRIAAPMPTVFAGSTADPQLLPRGELGVLVGPIPPIPPPGTQVARPATIDPTAAVLAGEPAPLAIDPARASIWLTGPDGRYRIGGVPKGKVTALAQADGFAEGRSMQIAVDLGQLVGDVDILLSAGTILVGKVTDQHGVPVLGAQITAKPTVGLVLDAFADDTGSYRLGPVSGAVELIASAYGHGEARRTIEIVAMRGPTAERREDLVLAVADAILAGTLDDAGGAPVPAATIEVVAGAAEGRRAVVAADGTFALDHLPAGPLRIRVTHPDYPPAELDATAESGTPAKVRLKLAFGGAVEGVLLDNGGTPVAGIPISGDGPGNATAETTSGPRGQWKLGPLLPGRWKLAVDVPGFLSATQELDVTAARAPGATSVRDVRIDLARGALVGGTVRDGRGQRVVGARIMVQRADGTGPVVEGLSDSSGEFRVRDCPTGELSVRAQHGDASGSVRTTVRPGTEVLSLSLEVR